jgi:hypothetical protein
MPVHKQGSGFQWGHHGKVYTGPGAAAKAAAQGRAAYANGYRGKHVARQHRPKGNTPA